jgi:hypothetical protein
MRRELLARSTSDTLRHQRTYLSGKLSNKLLSTQLQLAVALAQKKPTESINLWRVVQQWKAISLSDLLWDSQRYIPDSSVIDEKAKVLIEGEKNLVDKINMAEPHERPNLRRNLRVHWIQMASHPSLTSISSMKLGMGATLDHLREIRQISHRIEPENSTIIFIDWIRHHDNIILFAIRCSATSQTLNYWCLSLTYSEVENWVLRKLKEPSESRGAYPPRRKRLESTDVLMELSGLIDPLRAIIKGKELLVLCPSGVLNEIPIHAISFRGNDDPLLTTNPIVYSSSHAIMKSCVDNAFRKINSVRLVKNFVAFGRYGELNPTEDDLITEMVLDLAVQFDGVQTTGKALTRDAFRTSVLGADFIHYHGHATCESNTSIRALVLQPDPENGDNEMFMVDDIFQLQLQSPHVTLLACASGEQEFSYNDDPFGIVTAFLCAGATSVAGTLWPTDCRDARDFCDTFYEQIKEEESSVLNLAKVMQKTILKLRDDWDFDDPYHWAQFVLCKLLPLNSITLRFGTLILILLDGSWFCRNVSQ